MEVVEYAESEMGPVASDETSGDEVIVVQVESEDACVDLEKVWPRDWGLENIGE